jgi:hypothetical protein
MGQGINCHDHAVVYQCWKDPGKPATAGLVTRVALLYFAPQSGYFAA